jgi:hypothetical protein
LLVIIGQISLISRMSPISPMGAIRVIHTHKKRRSPLFIYQLRPSHCPIEQITQQETYAGMTTYYTIQAQYGYNHTHRHLLLLWFCSIK